MKRNFVISALIVMILAVLLSGCVSVPTQPSVPSNPYLPDKSSQYDLIKVSVNPSLFVGFQGSSSREMANFRILKNVSFSLLDAIVSCEEDAKYIVNTSNNEAEYKMVFSNAWKGDPDHEDGEIGSFLDFSISKDSKVYLHDSSIKIIDGLTGNLVGTTTTQMGSVTVKRVSSYVNLNVGTHSYSNVLKVQLSFSNYSVDGYAASSFDLSYFFVKSRGLLRIDATVKTDSDEIPLFSIEVLKENIGRYELGPSPATSLYPDDAVVSHMNDVILEWKSNEANGEYDVYLFNSNGVLKEFPSLKATSLNVGKLNQDIYLWNVVSVDANGLSTISKSALFSVY